jgi:hypothetical protein
MPSSPRRSNHLTIPGDREILGLTIPESILARRITKQAAD